LNQSRQPAFKAWIPAAIWLGIITLESTGIASSDNTSRFLFPFFHWLTGVDLVRFAVWNHILRKIGHFVGYFILSLLLFRAWKATIPPRARKRVDASSSPVRWCMVWARASFLMTVLVATLDEWHQTFLPSRTGRWQDVVLDSCAGLVAQVAIWRYLRRRNS